jgi:hypothetical protein
VAGARADGSAHRVGLYGYTVQDQQWTWSDEVFRIHGFRLGEVLPTTELLVSHQHPDDREQVAQAIGLALETGAPYSFRHRIVDAAGRERTVVVVGNGVVRDGAVVALRGYFIDVTEVMEEEVRERADAAVQASREHQGPLEQAKGALMLALGVDADAAFGLLAAKSQYSHVKVHTLAEELMAEVAAGRMDASAEALTDWLCGDTVASLAERERERSPAG